MTRIDRAAVGIAILLAALNAAAYFRAPALGFVEWDDQVYVSRNPIILRGLTWDGIRFAWSTMEFGNYIPVTWSSYLIDASLFGSDPAGYHVVNVVLHTLNCWLLFLLLRSWTGEIAASAVVAMLFAVHPLHVESVAWVSERKDVLSTLFLLLTLLTYSAYVESPSAGRYLLVMALFGLGLLSKSMLVTLPILLWLVDGILFRRLDAEPALGRPTSIKKVIVEKVPLLAMSIASGIATIIAQRQGGTAPDSAELGITPRILNMLDSYGWYIWKTIWPSQLSPFYPHPMSEVGWASPMIALASLAALALIAFRVRDKQPIIWFGFLWFVISFLPVIGLLQVGMQAHADRYVYVPHIGLLTMLVWLVRDVVARFSLQWWLNPALAALATSGGTWATAAQVAVWHDTESLWRQAILVDPDNGRAHSQLGLALSKSGRDRDAIEHLSQAGRSGVLRDVVWNEMGSVYERSGDLTKAAEYYRKTLEANPSHPTASLNLMVLEDRLKGKVVNESDLQRKAATQPDSSEHWNRLGLSQMRSGKVDAALRSFRKAVEVNPRDVASQTNLGLALWQAGNLQEARGHLAEAVKLAPGNVNARMSLADALELLGDRPAAIEQLEEVQRLIPPNQELTERLKRLRR